MRPCATVLFVKSDCQFDRSWMSYWKILWTGVIRRLASFRRR